mmetsp:Transcript_41269/g.110307  ORF Transcript_41269/g.110307 Transcript_41269/m.110307 type:complete len:201 (-) Transcript_41269:39-641(-)|eukprot:CAMPEP_0113684982 /NCGR_PEP_ID=MMETSP0038_2-20120614/14367_1 /TAXON_ID=2898 /ORGANISM="Cryptomonas paramecium" /LENGTH=200 /DNA_ID=CAMNT_0000604915 /DNA_START=74 /DNA_END=676 /DNA_ORIENTATION=+ /assembly_acc=CAM_ASM_000170
MQAPLPPGWEERWDPATNAHYYFNHTTQATQWQRPVQPPPPPYPPSGSYNQAPPPAYAPSPSAPDFAPYGHTPGVTPNGLYNQIPSTSEPFRPPAYAPGVPQYPPYPSAAYPPPAHLPAAAMPPAPLTGSAYMPPGGPHAGNALVSPYPPDYRAWPRHQRRAWRKANKALVKQYKHATKELRKMNRHNRRSSSSSSSSSD